MDESERVRIAVEGTDEDGESISFSTHGELTLLEGGWLLRYTEMTPDDPEGLQSIVLCEGKRVTVTRAGETLTTMVFQKQETFVSDYRTPAGSFQVRILPTEVTVRRRGLLGHIRLVYQISISTAFSPAQEMGIRTLEIRFAPCRH